MNPNAEIVTLLADTPDAIRSQCFSLLFDDLTLATGSSEMLAHPNVKEFTKLVKALSSSNPKAEEHLRDEVRKRWPTFFPSEFVVVRHSERTEEAVPESPVAAKAYEFLESGFLPELTAVKLACLVITEDQEAPEIRTSQVAVLLRRVRYKIPNPAALIRSLADRAQPAIEILDERVGPRQELQFRLLPEAIEEMKYGLFRTKTSAA